MEKTWKPNTAGILAIVAGAQGLIGSITLFFGFGVVSGALGIPTGYIPPFVPGLILGMAIPSVILNILAIVGGVYALKRQRWGFALAGSILAITASLILGILATVFIAQSKNEFE
jgi:hypothetical protein